jgi:nucleoside phosphorylase
VSALAKERDAYEHTTAELGEFISLNGLDCRYTSMGSLKGVNILLPRMGLVEASIATAKAIETFSPKCIVMGGICGGIESVADIGTLVVADPIWEYQTGKWHENGFQHDIYQEVMNSALTTEIKTFIARDPNLSKLKAGLTIDKKLLGANAIVAPMATGSAVVADSDKLTAINAQHRKMAAIDMEMYGVHRASSAARSGPLVFGAKVVVDTANSAKGDHYHEFGCALSARFCVSMLEKLAEIDMLPS